MVVFFATMAAAQNHNRTSHPKDNVNVNGGNEFAGDTLDGVGIKTKDPKAKVVKKVKTNRSPAGRRRKG